MTTPPLQPDSPETITARSRRQLVVLIAVATAMLLVGLRAALYFFPDSLGTMSRFECVLLSTTGIACPTCGGTRALVSLVSGSPLRAFYWNPLIATAAIALPVLGGLAVVAPARLDRVAGWAGRTCRSWWGRGLIVAAVVAQIVHMTALHR